MSIVEIGEKLAYKILKTCRGKGVFLVFSALENALESVIEQIPEEKMRNWVVVRLIHMLLSLPAFAGLSTAPAAGDCTTVSTIRDRHVRDATILRQAKALTDLAPIFWEGLGQAPGADALRKPLPPKIGLSSRQRDLRDQLAHSCEYELPEIALDALLQCTVATLDRLEVGPELRRQIVRHLTLLIAFTGAKRADMSEFDAMVAYLRRVPDEDERNQAMFGIVLGLLVSSVTGDQHPK